MIHYCRSNRIQVTAYSSFGSASYVELALAEKEDSLFDAEIIKKCSVKYDKTPGQVLLRWAVQQGLAVIPKTSKAERLKENADVFGWTLNPEEMEEIDNLNKDKRYNDPGVICEKVFGKPFPIFD